jgi:hypothetical protein
MEWFKFYERVVHTPKVQKLPGELFKTWINLLCVANQGDGLLPPIPDLAFTLRLTEEETATRLAYLQNAKLIDANGSLCEMHDWKTYQALSDKSTARVRKHREEQRKSRSTPSETTETVSNVPPETHETVSPVSHETQGNVSSVSHETNETVLEEIRVDEIREEKPICSPSASGLVSNIRHLSEAVDQRKARRRKSDNPLSAQQQAWFEDFYELYWRKKAPGDAEKAFARHCTTPERAAEIIAAVKAQTPEMMARPDDKRPYPASWLNDQRLRDEIETPGAALAVVGRPQPFKTKSERVMEKFDELMAYEFERRNAS